jgi:GDP-mannose 6-dehydrogenase
LRVIKKKYFKFKLLTLNIAVFGLGYVGAVNIACLSKLGNKVYGCDVKPHKVDLIKNGLSTVLEPQLDSLIKEGVTNGSILASTDAGFCVQNTDMALVCVGTPSDEDGSVNLDFILNTAVEIAKIIKSTGRKYTLVFRSTIPPGTIEDKIIPELDKVFGAVSHPVQLAFLPEFLREGSAVQDFFNCARIVAGIDNNNSAKSQIQKVFEFNKEIPLIFTDFRTAEFVKYVDNAYHATKVAFANEIYSIGSNLGVDVKKANEIFLLDNLLNISARYLKPGMPFGGSCLPKDSRAIIHMGQSLGLSIPFFNGVLSSNKAHQQRVLDKVLSFEGEKVLIYGLTFKQNTDDIRESPFLLLLNELIQQKKMVKVFDPNLNVMSLRVEFPGIVKYIETDFESVVNWAETIIVNKPQILELLEIVKEKKDIINCIDNNKYSYLGEQVHNLF